jgi:hypothetical protein
MGNLKKKKKGSSNLVDCTFLELKDHIARDVEAVNEKNNNRKAIKLCNFKVGFQYWF